MGMIQGSYGSRFPLKARQPFRVRGHLMRKNLEGNVAM
jgi:hypothetical protein